jgi:hypothetical protein
VVRQFGGYQDIPEAPIDLGRLHGRDLRSFQASLNYVRQFGQWIAMWNTRGERVVGLGGEGFGVSPTYANWFRANSAPFLMGEEYLLDPRVWVNPSYASHGSIRAERSHSVERRPAESGRRSRHSGAEPSRRSRQSNRESLRRSQHMEVGQSSMGPQPNEGVYIPTMSPGFQTPAEAVIPQSNWGQFSHQPQQNQPPQYGLQFATPVNMSQFVTFPQIPPSAFRADAFDPSGSGDGGQSGGGQIPQPEPWGRGRLRATDERRSPRRYTPSEHQ